MYNWRTYQPHAPHLAFEMWGEMLILNGGMEALTLDHSIHLTPNVG
jgi:hypothetical protein